METEPNARGNLAFISSIATIKSDSFDDLLIVSNLVVELQNSDVYLLASFAFFLSLTQRTEPFVFFISNKSIAINKSLSLLNP